MKVLVTTAMYPTPENPAYGSFVKTQVEALRQAGLDVRVHVLQSRIRKLKYPKGVLELRRCLARNPVDVVHAHFSYVGLAARLQRRVPLVVTYHGDDLLGAVADDTGRHSRFSRVMVRAGQWLGRRVEAAIVQSEEMAAKLAGCPHVFIAPHEIDFDTFRVVPRDEARRELGLDPAKPYLLFAANPDIHVKRFPLARQAYEAVRRQMPGLGLIVVYREPQPRLALYMNACDALVFTSFQEGSPNVVKQAMACNLPIVSTDVGDVREVIGLTEGCYLCRPEVSDFAERLSRVLARRERTCGRAAVQRFDRPIVTRQLIQVYQGAIERFHARRAGHARCATDLARRPALVGGDHQSPATR